jgi:hypothetical protein
MRRRGFPGHRRARNQDDRRNNENAARGRRKAIQNSDVGFRRGHREQHGQIHRVERFRIQPRVEDLGRRFVSRHLGICGRDPTHAIPTTGASLVLAIADQHLALAEQGGALGPVDRVIHAIGDVHHLVVIQPHHPGIRNIEICVVPSDYWIVNHRTGQLEGALNATRDYGEWIDHTTGRVRFGQPRCALLEEERRHIRAGRGYWGIICEAVAE